VGLVTPQGGPVTKRPGTSPSYWGEARPLPNTDRGNTRYESRDRDQRSDTAPHRTPTPSYAQDRRELPHPSRQGQTRPLQAIAGAQARQAAEQVRSIMSAYGRAPKICAEPGCVQLVRNASRCPEHSKPAYQGSTRGASTSSSAWKQLRLLILRRDNRQCRIADTGCEGLANEVDHILPVARGGSEFDPANCRAVCQKCHRSKSAREGGTALSGGYAAPPPMAQPRQGRHRRRPSAGTTPRTVWIDQIEPLKS
jgi:5-methylcytosine-specific restriction enzyme A